MFIIPVGATSIRITESVPTRNYLGKCVWKFSCIIAITRNPLAQVDATPILNIVIIKMLEACNEEIM